MREWIIANELADEEELNSIAMEAKEHVKQSRNSAWEKFLAPIKSQVTKTADLINNLATSLPAAAASLKKLVTDLSANREPTRRDVFKSLVRGHRYSRRE